MPKKGHPQAQPRSPIYLRSVKKNLEANPTETEDYFPLGQHTPPGDLSLDIESGLSFSASESSDQAQSKQMTDQSEQLSGTQLKMFEMLQQLQQDVASLQEDKKKVEKESAQKDLLIQQLQSQIKGQSSTAAPPPPKKPPAPPAPPLKQVPTQTPPTK